MPRSAGITVAQAEQAAPIARLGDAIDARLTRPMSHDGAQRLSALRQQVAEIKGALLAASSSGDDALAASIARVIAAL